VLGSQRRLVNGAAAAALRVRISAMNWNIVLDVGTIPCCEISMNAWLGRMSVPNSASLRN